MGRAAAAVERFGAVTRLPQKRVFRALADRQRLKILNILAGGRHSCWRRMRRPRR